MKKYLAYFFALFLISGGVAHLMLPSMYEPLIPEFIPAQLANIAAGIVEIIIGVLLIVPRYRYLGGLAFMVLMIAFLPIHLWDLVRDDPFFTPIIAAVIRIALQFLLIYAGWWMFKSNRD